MPEFVLPWEVMTEQQPTVDTNQVRMTATNLDLTTAAAIGTPHWHRLHDAKRDLSAAADEIDRLNDLVTTAYEKGRDDGARMEATQAAALLVPQKRPYREPDAVATESDWAELEAESQHTPRDRTLSQTYAVRNDPLGITLVVYAQSEDHARHVAEDMWRGDDLLFAEHPNEFTDGANGVWLSVRSLS
jgi:hypothetical protein